MLKKELISLLNECPEIIETLNVCREYGLKDYYIAGGAITQLIWNNLQGKPNLEKVRDFDIVYYSKTEDQKQAKTHQLEITNSISHEFPLDIINQAYVHEWYPKKFGNTIEQFNKTEDGIKTWLSAFAIGIRIRKLENIEIFAPYGLDDAFNMLVKPNKLAMNKDNYTQMTRSFKMRWECIKIEPWE